MFPKPCIATLAAFATILPHVTAAPFSTRSSSINATTFANLQLFSQYAAASYCPFNTANSSTPTPLTCPTKNCPLLQPTSTTTNPITSVYEFGNSLGHAFTFTDVTGFIAIDTNLKHVVLSFRGSHTFSNWFGANLDFWPADTDLCAGCQAWDGFWRSWKDARAGILSALNQTFAAHPDFKTIVVGHSLGGAIADLAAAELRKQNPDKAVDLYTYGAPRIGWQALTDFINTTGNNYRVTHLDDPVPKLPPQGGGIGRPGFANIGPEYWIGSANGVSVTRGDVTVFSGSEMDGPGGDFGDVSMGEVASLDVQAHLWYFGPIAGCDAQGANPFSNNS